jgi:hypothetical protein
MNTTTIEVEAKVWKLAALLKKAGFKRDTEVQLYGFPNVELTPQSVFYINPKLSVELQIEETVYVFKCPRNSTE